MARLAQCGIVPTVQLPPAASSQAQRSRSVMDALNAMHHSGAALMSSSLPNGILGVWSDTEVVVVGGLAAAVVPASAAAAKVSIRPVVCVYAMSTLTDMWRALAVVNTPPTDNAPSQQQQQQQQQQHQYGFTPAVRALFPVSSGVCAMVPAAVVSASAFLVRFHPTLGPDWLLAALGLSKARDNVASLCNVKVVTDWAPGGSGPVQSGCVGGARCRWDRECREASAYQEVCGGGGRL